MNERDFSIGDRKFKLNKIDTLKQNRIARRLAPILGDLIPLAQKFASKSPEELDKSWSELAAPVLSGWAKMSDEDSEKVLLGLCSAVEMQQMPIGNWARVATDAGLMFQDLDLKTLYQIAGRAFQYNLANFSSTSPRAS